MVDLIKQGLISVAHDYYFVLIHKRFIIALPDPDRVSIIDCANWLYGSVDPDTKEGYDAENMVVGEQMNEDQQH